MRIHVIGDSHTGVFRSVGAIDISCPAGFTSPPLQERIRLTNVNDGIFIHYVGPMTAFRVARDGITAFDLSEFFVRENDYVIYVFGEIDCRCNIYKHLTDAIDYKINISKIVEGYIRTVKDNHNKFKLKKSCIYNVIPPAQKKLFKDYAGNPYPCLGTDHERQKFTEFFNKLLKENCLENNIIFFDLYDKCIGNDGCLREDLTKDSLHLDHDSPSIGRDILDFITKNF